MKYDPSGELELITPAQYVVEVVRGKSGLTKTAQEIWYLDYKILAVHKADDDNLADAGKCVGAMLSDRMIDHPNMSFRWRQFLPAMFPELKQAGKEAEVHAEQCAKRVLIVDVEIIEGKPEYNDAEYINRVKGYMPFTDEKSEVKSEEKNVSSNSDDFGGQF